MRWLSPWAIYDEASGTYVWRSEDATPRWNFPNLNGDVLITNDEYLRFVETFVRIRAEAAAYIRSNEDLSAALPIVFTITNQPDVPRSLKFAFDSHAQITDFTLVITYVNAAGVATTETFTAADGWSFETAGAVATITSISMTARTGTGAADTMDVGLGSKLGLGNLVDGGRRGCGGLRHARGSGGNRCAARDPRSGSPGAGQSRCIDSAEPAVSRHHP